MDQIQSVEVINGRLELDEATLRAAQIVSKARVILQERAILILPESGPESGPEGGPESGPEGGPETDQSADPVNSTFGMIQLPPAVAREIAESKELEYEL